MLKNIRYLPCNLLINISLRNALQCFQTVSSLINFLFIISATNVASFQAGSNAVTPIPSWPNTYIPASAKVPVSTDPPNDDNKYGAVDFNSWKDIGKEVLVKSNINNWLACKPNVGSFTDWIPGSLDCRLLKSITINCPTLPVDAAFRFRTGNDRGPSIDLTHFFFYWDGTTDSNWPTHDPCGTNQAKHLSGPVPEGQIWLREV